MDWHEKDGVRWLQARLAGAGAAFTTRLGGVSEGPFASLNVAVRTDDDRRRVRENRRRLSAALGFAPDTVLIARQVHGNEMQRHESKPKPSPWADAVTSPVEADAQVTSTPGLTPLVMVADCLPVALAGPRGVAMAHCGWRGLAAGVAGGAARAVAATDAAIGPGIGPCCYQVGEEVLAAFVDYEDGPVAESRLDLAAIVREQLEDAGVQSIETAGLCTSCNPELFFSHRRDRGRTGRQAGLAWLEA